jgi:hypothetical protein
MIAVRSYLPSLLTFPGVVLRQVVHAGFCRIFGVKILDIRYFRADTPSGYVFHEMPDRLSTAFWLALGPLVLHSFLCFALCLPALVPFLFRMENADFSSCFQLWLGLSIGAHAFPPLRDVGNLWDLTRREVKGHGAGVRLAFPMIAFLRIAQRLSLYGFDVAYAALLGVGLPWVVLSRLFPSV